ncbi:hypothetical protein ES703_94715 [subsurface metagenome]
MHLATGRMLLENPNIPPEELPLYKFMLSRPYPRNKPRRAVIAYLNKYKQVFKLIKARGYIRQSKRDPTDSSKLGLIPVRRTVSGTIILKDGHRRLTAIRVIGKQKRIKVEVV